MSALRAIAGGFALAIGAAVIWVVARPLRNRPRPPTEVSARRYRRLGRVIGAVLIALVTFFALSLAITAIR